MGASTLDKALGVVGTTVGSSGSPAWDLFGMEKVPVLSMADLPGMALLHPAPPSSFCAKRQFHHLCVHSLKKQVEATSRKKREKALVTRVAGLKLLKMLAVQY